MGQTQMYGLCRNKLLAWYSRIVNNINAKKSLVVRNGEANHLEPPSASTTDTELHDDIDGSNTSREETQQTKMRPLELLNVHDASSSIRIAYKRNSDLLIISLPKRLLF